MKISILLLFLFVLTGCYSNNDPSDTATKSRFLDLLPLYKDTTFDTLNAFSSEYNYSDTFRFKGTKLDSLSVSLFPKELSDSYGSGEEFFACYKFPLDSRRLGLITRAPSTYESSSLKLLVFDKMRDSITSFIELSELVGDAGASFDKRSWIIKGKNGAFNVLGWVQEGYDHSVDDEKDTTIEINNTYYLLSLSKQKFDTVNINVKALKKEFSALLNSKASR